MTNSKLEKAALETRTRRGRAQDFIAPKNQVAGADDLDDIVTGRFLAATRRSERGEWA